MVARLEMMVARTSRFRSGGIRGKILALVACAGAIVALCVGAFVLQVRGSWQQQVLQDQETLARGYASTVNEYFKAARSAAEAASMNATIRQPVDLALTQPDLKG